MLQCQRCQQWFHQECIRNPNVPQLLLGDRFWEFVCTLCTGNTEEIVRRLPIGYVDALHLILFNLIVSNRKEHHDLETAIIPLFKKNLRILQCNPNNSSNYHTALPFPSATSGQLLKSSRLDQPNFLEALLKSNKGRFKCGSSSSKKAKYWTLIKVGPPLAPHNKAYQKDQYYSSVIDVNFKQKNPNSLKNGQRRPAVKSATSGNSGQNLHPKKIKRRNFKESLDSLGDSSDTSSFGSLDVFIPRPKDFEGQNNPFRSGLHSEPLEFVNFARPSKRERKRRWSPPRERKIIIYFT